MAKSRLEKNKALYENLDEEMKSVNENSYEEKLKAIDPSLNDNGEFDDNLKKEAIVNKKSETKTNTSMLNVIAKEVNGKQSKKGELTVVKKEEKKQIVNEEEEHFDEPISFTDKLSVEEILRAKIEQQQKIKNDKKSIKKGPNDASYTTEMMQERIRQHEGINVRKEVNIKTKDYKWLAISLLVVSLIAVIVIGCLIIFRIIKL